MALSRRAALFALLAAACGRTSPEPKVVSGTKRLRESYGLMVNYLYDPDTIEANHEAFATAGVVARSAFVDALLQPPSRRRGGLRLRGG